MTNTRYGWVMVAIGALMTCVAVGAMFSLAVFLQPITDATGWSGVAAGSFFAPMIAAVTAWFERHRSLAVSLVSVGVGVAPMTISPFAAWLVSQMDWRAAQVVLAILVWATLVP